jgi:hypothetical protein
MNEKSFKIIERTGIALNVRINTGKAFACRIQGCKGEQYIHP